MKRGFEKQRGFVMDRSEKGDGKQNSNYEYLITNVEPSFT